MSIENNTAPTSPKAVVGAASHSGKGKVKAGDQVDAAAGGGFAALLTALEQPSDPIGAADIELATEEETTQIAAMPSVDPLIPPAPTLPNDLTMLLAQAGTAVSDKLSAVGDAGPVGAKGGIPHDLALPLAQAGTTVSDKLSAVGDAGSVGAKSGIPNDLALLLAQAGTAVSDKLSAVGDAGSVGAKGGIRLVASAIGAKKPEMAAATASLGSYKFIDTRQNISDLQEQTAQGLSAQTHMARGAELQADVAAKLAESRALKQSSFADVVAREPVLSGALLISGSGDSLLRPADRAAAKWSNFSTGSAIDGSWGQQALQAGNRMDAPVNMADPSTASLESMVADTVSYWVTQGVQNAELKLDGFGDQAVEVSISLKGDEAHIGFRTDQPEIRQILEGAAAHLKDLLISEGLVLSGVSVGTSGQDGKGAQERRNHPEARQATITTTEVALTESRRQVNQSVGRAVDLFV